MADHFYIAVDQMGNHFHCKDHPRKELMERVGVKSAQKMYVDGTDGKPYHVGYVVGGHWFRLFEARPFRKPA